MEYSVDGVWSGSAPGAMMMVNKSPTGKKSWKKKYDQDSLMTLETLTASGVYNRVSFPL